MHTIRVWFSKQGEASYISHLDLQRVMSRTLRKAKLPVWYSQGYHPHIYLTFALPLPLGQESICEIMDYRTEEDPPDLDRVYYGLKDAVPRGLDIFRVSLACQKTGEIGYARYLIRFPAETVPQAARAVAAFNMAESAAVIKMGKKNGRKGVEKELELKEFITEPLILTRMDADMVLDVMLP
ncbi:MAG: TIGR03936 family radical SAM-associated protein, partial [Oscillospiraceae bacterium]|nr:TIGR03936 family radical SAM-associated protein [Oscillospiraceae bacterium]